jgi:hypothetical protein
MKFHRPWQPHLDRDPLFNPFVPSTDRPIVDDHVELTPDESEQEEQEAAEQMPDEADVKKE